MHSRGDGHRVLAVIAALALPLAFALPQISAAPAAANNKSILYLRSTFNVSTPGIVASCITYSRYMLLLDLLCPHQRDVAVPDDHGFCMQYAATTTPLEVAVCSSFDCCVYLLRSRLSHARHFRILWRLTMGRFSRKEPKTSTICCRAVGQQQRLHSAGELLYHCACSHSVLFAPSTCNQVGELKMDQQPLNRL